MLGSPIKPGKRNTSGPWPVLEGRQSDERDRGAGEVSTVFEEAQLLDPYDQELHEYVEPLPTVATRTG